MKHSEFDKLPWLPCKTNPSVKVWRGEISLNSGSTPLVAVTVLAESRKEAAVLVRMVKATNIARVILFVRISSLASAIDKIRESPARVALVAVPTDNPQPAIDAIECVCREVRVSVIASGDTLTPTHFVAAKRVVEAMHAGARGWIQPTASPQELTEMIIQLLGNDDPDVNRGLPPGSGPPDGSLPPSASVRLPRPTSPRTHPSRTASPET